MKSSLIGSILAASLLARAVRADCVPSETAPSDASCVVGVTRGAACQVKSDPGCGVHISTAEFVQVGQQRAEAAELGRRVTALIAADDARRAQVALLQKGLTAQQQATDAADAKAAAESKRADQVTAERDAALAKADLWCRSPALCTVAGAGLMALGIVVGFVAGKVSK